MQPTPLSRYQPFNSPEHFAWYVILRLRSQRNGWLGGPIREREAGWLARVQ